MRFFPSLPPHSLDYSFPPVTLRSLPLDPDYIGPFPPQSSLNYPIHVRLFSVTLAAPLSPTRLRFPSLLLSSPSIPSTLRKTPIRPTACMSCPPPHALQIENGPLPEVSLSHNLPPPMLAAPQNVTRCGHSSLKSSETLLAVSRPMRFPQSPSIRSCPPLPRKPIINFSPEDHSLVGF